MNPSSDPRPWSARRHIIVGLMTLAALVGGFGGWAGLTTIAGAVVVSGRIEVEQNRQIVQHPDGGVVESIHVAEGARVLAGQLLLRLDGATIGSELAIVEGQLYEIFARRGRLEAERDDAAEIGFPAELLHAAALRPELAELAEGQRRLFAARRETLAQQLDKLAEQRGQIRSQIAGLEAQGAALTTQLALIGQERASQQELLDKGLAQASRVLALEREAARLQGEVGALTAARAQSAGRITEIEIEALRLAAARREEANAQLRDIGYRELELAERRRALAERVLRLDIVAPVSGVVLGLQVTTPRAVLRAADPVLYLIPQDRPLVIAVNVAPIHIDQVRVGQAATLVFPAFAARTTPKLAGHVTVVSADAFTDSRSQATYYRAEIMLEPGAVEALEGMTLLPGMPVEAFIRTDARTPIAYLVKPFADYFTRAFREN